MGTDRRDTASELVIIDDPLPESDETARERVAALLTKRQELDARQAKYTKLVAGYGGNRRARRRARAEVDRDAKRAKLAVPRRP